jgi:Pentatricopeptide repeat domain/PPR repeat
VQVYLELEKWSQTENPYKSVAALNCVLLGCANIWDLDRTYETFQAMDKIGVTPDIHSYNALLYAFGKHQKVMYHCFSNVLIFLLASLSCLPNFIKLWQTAEACNVFDHLVSIGVKPNATTYSLIADAHLINRDAKSALKVIDEMVCMKI